MIRMQAIEFLKLHLGTLFLCNYEMPSFEEVTQSIEDGIKPFNVYQPFVSVGCILNHLLCKIIDRESQLLNRANVNLLQSFDDRLPLFGDKISPKDKVESPKQFFEKFYDTEYTPQNKEEIARIVEWIVCVVGFDEATEKRTEEALEFLKRLSKYLHENMQCKLSLEFAKSNPSDEKQDPSKEETQKVVLIVNMRDDDFIY